MGRRKSATATVTAIGARYVAIKASTPKEYKTRSGAVGSLTDELDDFIRWARFYDHASEQRLLDIKAEIESASEDRDWEFPIAGMTARCGLRFP